MYKSVEIIRVGYFNWCFHSFLTGSIKCGKQNAMHESHVPCRSTRLKDTLNACTKWYIITTTSTGPKRNHTYVSSKFSSLTPKDEYLLRRTPTTF